MNRQKPCNLPAFNLNFPERYARIKMYNPMDMAWL